MKVTDLTANIEFKYYLDFKGKIEAETEPKEKLIEQAEEIIFLDKKVPFTFNFLEEYDLVYIKFRNGSEYLNCLYLCKITS